jgi:hypothetical protein
MPNEAVRPWKMLLPLILVLVLAMAWSIYWFVAIGWPRTRLQSEREKLAGQGVSLTCTEESWGGFPFRFEFTCSSPLLKCRTRQSAVRKSPRGRTGIQSMAGGIPHRWPDGIRVQTPLPVTAQHERIVASITLGKRL